MAQVFRSTLKTQETPLWIVRLPTVLLALRNTVMMDVGHSPADLVYGTTLRFPGEYIHPAQQEPRLPDLLAKLRTAMAQL